MSVKKRKIDFSNLRIIDSSEIPPSSRVSSLYRELLKRIDKGKAVILTENDVKFVTARSAIRKLQKKGEFKDYSVTQRTINGKKTLYIIHEDKKNKLTKTLGVGSSG